MARDDTFTDDLNSWLERHHYSARAGAAVLGVSHRTLEGWSAGRFTPAAADLYRRAMADHDLERAALLTKAARL